LFLKHESVVCYENGNTPGTINTKVLGLLKFHPMC